MEIEFRDEDDDRAVVRLTCARDGNGLTLTVRVELPGLTCDYGPEYAYQPGLHAFLETLAADWRGWDGIRTAELASGISVEASHSGDRIWFQFLIGWGWQVRAPISVAPGESLSRLERTTAEAFAHYG